MITIQSGKMIIPEEERFVGFAGDDQSNTKQFVLVQTRFTGAGAVCTLYLRFDDDRVVSAPLPAHTAGEDTVLTWHIRSEQLLKSGIVMAQIKVVDGDGSVRHYSWDYFIVGASAERADDGGEIDVLNRTEFEERMAQAVSAARALSPYIGDDDNWYVYDAEAGDFVRSVKANGVDVDSAVSASSANPVENRAVKAYIDAADNAKVDQSRTIAGCPLTHDITTTALRSALSVPENTSQLSNTSGFITLNDVYNKLEIFRENSNPPVSWISRAYPANAVWYNTQSGEYWTLASCQQSGSAYQHTWKKWEIPTKTSDLTNDSNFQIAQSSIPEVSTTTYQSQVIPNTSDSSFTSLKIGQYFFFIRGEDPHFGVKTGTDSWQYAWWDLTYIANLNIPSAVSELTNDSGFLTQHQDISGKANIADVPTKTSDLTNDSHFGRTWYITDNSAWTKDNRYHSGIQIGHSLIGIRAGDLIVVTETQSGGLPNYQRLFICVRLPSGSGHYYDSMDVVPVRQDISEKMDLPTVSVPANAGNTAPDTTDSAYTALSDGQIFKCVISGNLTYWLKYTTANDVPSPFRIAFFSDIPDVSGKENASNKVTSLSAQSTDTQYPSAKCVFDSLAEKANASAVPTRTSDLTNDSGFMDSAFFFCSCMIDSSSDLLEHDLDFDDIIGALEDELSVYCRVSCVTEDGVCVLLVPLSQIVAENGQITEIVFETVADMSFWDGVGVTHLELRLPSRGEPLVLQNYL